MVKITKIYKDNCSPCIAVGNILTNVERPYELEELNIESSSFKVRKEAKRILMKYATTNIPFLLFKREDGTEYAAHYIEAGIPTVEQIVNNIDNGECQ